MDYLAVNQFEPVQAATIVQGVANACQEASCALLGGETAEMPDVYAPGAFDLAGTIVGVVEEEDAQNGSTITEGDVILGLPSNGLHTNGYSYLPHLRILTHWIPSSRSWESRSLTLLLRPHRSYLSEVSLAYVNICVIVDAISKGSLTSPGVASRATSHASYPWARRQILRPTVGAFRPSSR